MPINAIDIDDDLLLGRYRLLEVKGSGAFGTVQVCWDPRLMRRVAIKTIPLMANQPVVKPGRKRGKQAAQAAVPPNDALEQEQRRERMLRAALAETRTASMLSHPNIVSMLDFENDDENAYIIMEYVEGASLAELLDATEDGLLTSDEAAAVVEAVCDALQFAHDNGVLHLDIKPDNILVEASGRIKLADFGMAALSSATGFTGARGGTVGYMPPEQIEGGEVDVRTDVFAFGCVMYEALTGVRPFSAPTLQQSLELVRAGAADPCALSETISEIAADALLVSIDPDPSVRPSSASAMADELGAGLGRPKVGRRSLATLVALVTDDSTPDADDEEDAQPEDAPWDETGPLLETFPSLPGRFLALVAAASAAATTGFAVTSCAADASVAPGIVAGCAVGTIGLVAPQLAGACAVVALAVACALAHAWPLAVAVGIAGAAWWLAVCRRFPRGSAATMAGSIVPATATPLPAVLSGLFLSPGRAAASAAVGVLFSIALCALAASGTLAGFDPARLWSASPLQVGVALRQLLTSGSTWLGAAGWIGGSALLAALCHDAPPGRCYAGCGAAFVVFVATALLVARMENGGTSWELDPGVLAGVICSTILGILVLFLLGTPRSLGVDGQADGAITDNR